MLPWQPVISVMARTHYEITARELEDHPELRLLWHPTTLSLYYAARLLGRQFLCRTSGWSGVHLRALKVVHRENPLSGKALDY